MHSQSQVFEWAKALLPLAVALFVAGLGLIAYAKQRRLELEKTIYLDSTVDRIAADIDFLLNVFWHNWQVALHALQVFRGAEEKGPTLAKRVLDGGLRNLEPGYLNRSIFYRLRWLVGDDAFSDAVQQLHAFVVTANGFFGSDFRSALELASGEPTTPEERVAMHESYSMNCLKLSDESHHFDTLIGALQEVRKHLEVRVFTFEPLEELKYQEGVRVAVALVRERYHWKGEAKTDLPRG